MFDGVFSEVKSQLTAPQASVEKLSCCICSTGLNNADSGSISGCISVNVTSAQDRRRLDEAATLKSGSTARERAAAAAAV